MKILKNRSAVELTSENALVLSFPGLVITNSMAHFHENTLPEFTDGNKYVPTIVLRNLLYIE